MTYEEAERLASDRRRTGLVLTRPDGKRLQVHTLDPFGLVNLTARAGTASATTTHSKTAEVLRAVRRWYEGADDHLYYPERKELAR